MGKMIKPGKTSVELRPSERPSRIRRDPVPPEKPTSLKVPWVSHEREIWLALIGIVLFALAINAISIGFGAITN